MILYNVTLSVDTGIHTEWLQWMVEVHIPAVMATGLFTEYKVLRIEAYEEGGVSYAIQYLAASRQAYERYRDLHASQMQAAHLTRYGAQVSAFRTVMEVIYSS